MGLKTLQTLQTTAKVYFVNSSTGDDSENDGLTPDTPFATLDHAVGVCTASKGDVIYLAPGHAETLAAANAVDLDVAGISVIGLGNGDLKPTFTFDTSTAASIRINAKNVLLRNIRCVAGVDSLVKFIDVNKDYATIEDCEFVNGSSLEYLSGINIATTFDFTTIRRCKFRQSSDPTGTNAGADTGAIYLVDSENVTIEDCQFTGYFETAFIHNRTTGAANLWVKGCYGICSLSDAQPFKLVSTATGGAIGGGFITPAATDNTESALSGTIPAGFFMFSTRFGNDGGGGQNAVTLSDAS